MKAAWLWTGGGFEPCGGVPLADRGFRYGMSLFETVLIRAGAPVFLPAHLVGLQHACKDRAFAVDEAALVQTGDLIARSGIQDGVARIYVTAGDGALTSPVDACRVILFCEARDPIPPRAYHRGYDLGLKAAPHMPLFNGLKTSNYWANLDAFQRGVARHNNETLLFSPGGALISACLANVFIVKDGKTLTPAPGSGTRGGVVRHWVMRRHAAGKAVLTRDDVLTADEIFLTSSWLGVMPAASVEGRPLPAATTGRALHHEYENALEALA